MINYPDSDSALDGVAAATGRPPAVVQQTLALERSWRSPPDTLTLEPTYRVSAAGIIDVELAGHRLRLDDPVRLVPVEVPKPWGRELWFSGIEARGESQVQTDSGELPLSQFLALAPRRLLGGAPLVLLKILDPTPQPVFGDLYFELHEQKQEVYVVTHVDPEAWPQGRGAIRFGMNQARRRSYVDDATFRADYLAAVRAYEQVRRAIDAGAADRAEEERAQRAAMDAFTELRELVVGDVVVVPTRLPHSLQHGVRVIEFQTPTYERHIISFAQKVLTQEHWDSTAAVARMQLEPPEPPAFEAIAPGVERIVSFPDFRVWRVEIASGAEFALPTHPSHALCMVARGEVQLEALALAAEQAALVPGLRLTSSKPPSLRNTGDDPAVVLVAAADL